MKIFAAILALFILSLSANTFDGIECLCQKYEIAANIDGNQQSDDGSCTNGCSPFHLCHICSGFILSSTVLIVKPVSNNTSSTPVSHPQQFIPVFYGNIWQPPKIG
ncbi:hypothetical protein [Parabacteroides sp. PF5-6]|uniref:hypothetical protein n=1 Tax=Parabacteroides sp. PF5-6 TaxID=1742403 RepID=UPI002405BECD|nr:hypothetical protein [Parabacteroides sp. PF5-6]MDF9830683.1 hypothetical protein [Parabacteroides sp. PF5-6]